MSLKSQTIQYFISFLFVFFLLAGCDKKTDPKNEEPFNEDQLPQIEINTNGGIIVDEPKIDATITIDGVDVTAHTGNIGIEIRGASSQMFPKKSYGFETRDESNEDLDVPLLDFPEEEDWILYAPYSDKSLMRNVLIYDLSRGMDRYASRCEFVELSINQQYMGVYVFMEKLKRDGGRIDINKLKDDENTGEDLTGGYILKIDKTAGSNLGDEYNEMNSFTSAYAPNHSTSGQNIYFLYEYPDAEDITPEQKTYISSYMSDFEAALSSVDFTDPELGYAAYIDASSFIDFFLLNELSNNVDGYRLSTFMHKGKNEKLKMGPIWDFNLAFGNANYCNGEASAGWAYRFNERCPDDFWQIPFWWERLLEDPAYVAQLKARWESLRSGAFSEAAILNTIDNYKLLLERAEATEGNFTTWDVLGNYVWPNNYIGLTYDEEINYLKDWVTSRLSWMDGAIDAL